VPCGPRGGLARGGQSHAVHAGAERWPGLGGVAGWAAVVLLLAGPQVKPGEGNGQITFLQILHEGRDPGKTRNHLMLSRTEGYRDLGANYFDARRQFTVARLTQRMKRLGSRVYLEPVAASAA
jgi:hypothetical protein